MCSLFLPGLLEGGTPQGLSNGHEIPPEMKMEVSEEKAAKDGTAVIPIGLRSWVLISSPEVLGDPSFSMMP